MTSLRYILASLRHFRRIHLAVAAGVAVATAVLTGALLVGDSVRGSLRGLTLERLGHVDSALVAPHLFRAALADELAASDEFQDYFVAAEPVILMTGTLQSDSGGAVRRATDVSLIGCRENFWSLGAGGPAIAIGENEIALTEPVARELGVSVGARLLLRVPTVSAMPSDSVLGEKSETSRSRSFTFAAVLPIEGLARFGLAPSQHSPRNAFLSLASLQNVIDQPGKVNGILVATETAEVPSSEEAEQALRDGLRPTIEDYGLVVERIDSPLAMIEIAARQLVLAPEVVGAAEEAFGAEQLQPVVTYLANTIRVGKGDSQRTIPYSTITGVNSSDELGPLLDGAGEAVRLADDEIALNRWAADRLAAEVGDKVTITYYEPESAHGQLREHDPVTFRLAHIADLVNADGKATAAADPKLTPELPGVTDRASINDWELPFELVETIGGEDEDYWDQYRTTPKAFVSLATAERLWPSRWGTISLLRLPCAAADGDSPSVAESYSAEDVENRLLRQINPESLGMAFLPVKSRGLAAASGTTPFDGLFLGFSFFLIGAAIMLIALLFQLGIEQRAKELGILGATGIGRKQMTRLLSHEGLLVAAIGAVVGTAAGVFYAWLMITGLRTWWVDAIATPFLELHLTSRSLVLGWLAGVVVSWLTIRLSIRRLVHLPVGRLLAGQTDTVGGLSSLSKRSRFRVWRVVRIVLLCLIVALVWLGFQLRAEAQAGAFFGSGALVLVLLLGEIRQRLRMAIRNSPSRSGFNLASLAALNIALHPGRSTLTIGLVSAASFLILAISAFRLETSDAGTGGFELLATSDQPVHYDLDTPEGRLELGFSDDVSDRLASWRIYSLRVADGEDASCLNLYRPTQPRMLGVPDTLIERDGFAWSTTASGDGETSADAAQDGHAPTEPSPSEDNPWRLLNRTLGDDVAGRPIVPVVLDMNTAYYSLHLSGVGARLEIRDGADQPVTLEVVGLLKNSVLQGSLLIGEQNFLRLFPDVGGYQFFLIEQRNGQAPRGAAQGKQGGPSTRPDTKSNRIGPLDDVAPSVPTLAADSGGTAELLETTLAAEGFDATGAREQLAGYLAVQNTYLSTFQTIGLLGLLLGTVGLAIVQLRSVLERRGELALMRASGFRRDRLVSMVLWENVVLLVGGLAVGSLAAAIATLPQWARYDADVPWAVLAALLGVIALVGLIASWMATRSALRAPLVAALRGD